MVALGKQDRAPTAAWKEDLTAIEDYSGTPSAAGEFRLASIPSSDPIPFAVKNWHVIIESKLDDGTAIKSRPLRVYIEEYRECDGDEFIAYLNDIPSLSGYGESLQESIATLVDLVIFDFLHLRDRTEGLSLDAKARRDLLASLFVQ